MPISTPTNETSAGPDLLTFINKIPLFTRGWFLGSVVVSLLARFGILSSHWLILFWSSIFSDWQVWRLITALFFFPISPQTGFKWLINLYFIYSYSSILESETFVNRPADYLTLLIFNWFFITIASLFMNMYFMMTPMVMSVIYVWAQLNKDMVVSFWFGTKFKAIFLPWILLAFNFIINGGGLDDLIGIIVGHLYYFLMFKYPQDFGGDGLIPTPQFLINRFPATRSTVVGMGGIQNMTTTNRTSNQQSSRSSSHNWGSGNTLGTS